MKKQTVLLSETPGLTLSRFGPKPQGVLRRQLSSFASSSAKKKVVSLPKLRFMGEKP